MAKKDPSNFGTLSLTSAFSGGPLGKSFKDLEFPKMSSTHNGEVDGPVSTAQAFGYLRHHDVVEEEKREIGYHEFIGIRTAEKSGVDEFVTKGIEHLEYAAMIAHEGNHYEELERITDRLDDLCEEYGIEQSDTYDAHITTPAP